MKWYQMCCPVRAEMWSLIAFVIENQNTAGTAKAARRVERSCYIGMFSHKICEWKHSNDIVGRRRKLKHSTEAAEQKCRDWRCGADKWSLIYLPLNATEVVTFRWGWALWQDGDLSVGCIYFLIVNKAHEKPAYSSVPYSSWWMFVNLPHKVVLNKSITCVTFSKKKKKKKDSALENQTIL